MEKKHTKNTHKKYTPSNSKKCVFLDYLQWPRRGCGDRAGVLGGGRITDYFLENLFVLVM